jgi:hypothetical protein
VFAPASKEQVYSEAAPENQSYRINEQAPTLARSWSLSLRFVWDLGCDSTQRQIFHSCRQGK